MNLPLIQACAMAALCLTLNACAPATSLQMTPRRALAATRLDGRVYATGGWNGDATQLNLVEVFNTARHSWSSSVQLNHARSQHGLLTADGYLYAIGGWSA